jgi:hypothetical protein
MEKNIHCKGLNERGWALLIAEIKKGNVVPIIGNELLKINVEGKSMLLSEFLIQSLAEKLNIDYSIDLNYTQIASNPKWKEIESDAYYEIYDVLNKTKFEVPEALRKLAQIKEFKLILTTTFDDLAKTALEEIWGKDSINTLQYEKRTNGQDIFDSATQILYYMFGKANIFSRSYVLTEDDLLEFLHYWLDENFKPKKLSNILREKYLLVIGCNYPNWLFRFFFHSMKNSPPPVPGSKVGMVADSRIEDDLFSFLCRADAQMHHNAEKFIEDLLKHYPLQDSPAQTSFINEVFISYASEDEGTAFKIAEAFKLNNSNTWFDKKELELSDDYEKKIRRNIQESKAFVPILSKNVLTNSPRFFKGEWTWAIKQSEFRSGIPFIFPIIIDDLDVNNYIIPDEFRRLHCVKLDDSNISDIIKKIIRTVRKTND